MFDYDSIPAFLLRLSILFLLFSSYPLVNYFTINMILKLFWPNAQLSSFKYFLLNFSVTSVPLLFTMFYPNVGSILAYTGSLSGFAIIYLLPVLVHLK